ncbi:MAG TPA: helix-turn-helix transcriptional regulator [Wenzhouxiangella sp.]|nr:helix-turn-helix transcriptional regulator [Wenzhouxiangella sp.]
MGSKPCNRLREHREACGRMTQQALAEKVGVSRQTIIAIESGRYSPSLEVALKLAKVFDKSVEDLFWLPDS